MTDLNSLRSNAASIRSDIDAKEALLSAAESRKDERAVTGIENELRGLRSRLRDFESDIANAERA